MILGLGEVGWLAVRWWVWLYFLFSIIVGIFSALYWKREAVIKLYFQTRFPEKVIKIFIHYKSGMFNIYWRLIPDNNLFKVSNLTYEFNDEQILRENDFFSLKQNNKKTLMKLGDAEYYFEDLALINQKGKKWAEIHYFHNNPKPLSFDFTNNKLNFTSKQMTDFEQNDLFVKLLTLDQEKKTLFFLIIMVGLNLFVTIFIVAKMMGWIK